MRPRRLPPPPACQGLWGPFRVPPAPPHPPGASRARLGQGEWDFFFPFSFFLPVLLTEDGTAPRSGQGHRWRPRPLKGDPGPGEEGPAGTAGISRPPHPPWAPTTTTTTGGGRAAAAGSEPQLCPRWHISRPGPGCPPGPPRLTHGGERGAPASVSPRTKVVSERMFFSAPQLRRINTARHEWYFTLNKNSRRVYSEYFSASPGDWGAYADGK